MKINRIFNYIYISHRLKVSNIGNMGISRIRVLLKGSKVAGRLALLNTYRHIILYPSCNLLKMLTSENLNGKLATCKVEFVLQSEKNVSCMYEGRILIFI